MDYLLGGIKTLTLGIVAALTTATSIIRITPQPTPTPTPNPVTVKNIVVRSGEYSYSGYTLKYTLQIPKDGGTVTGSFSGVCEGPISGIFDGQEGGKVQGLAEANCKIAIFSYNLKASYDANLYLKEGKIDVNWAGEIPYTPNKGSFTIGFEPAN